MTPWILAALALAAFAAWSWARPDPVKLADRALTTGDLAPVLTALARVRPADQPTEYHRVIRRYWDGYHREQAVEVAKAFARAQPEAPVAQYWLDKAIKSEPEIARACLDEGFLGAFFKPAVAAKCGSYG